MLDTRTRASGKWSSILKHFGVPSRYTSGKHTDCPRCKTGKDRYRYDGRFGNGDAICNQCSHMDGFDILMSWTGQGFKEVAHQVDQLLSESNYKEDKRMEPQRDVDKIKQTLRMIIRQSEKVEKSKYLLSRGITHMPDLRFTKTLPYYEGNNKLGDFSAMLGVITGPEGKCVAIHRTYLQNGTKADVPQPKKLTPALRELSGCFIKLYPAGETLAIAEGIETAAAVHELFGIPCWSLVSTSIMESFVPPGVAKKIIIAADNDLNFSGQSSAFKLAKKLSLTGIDVEVKIPDIPGDWCDVLMRQKGLE